MKQHDQARCRSYGGPAGDDTHGSGRFASDRETRPFVQGGDGLLIGRDRKSGKPLRYTDPAHLLTIAPTRTGKGVGTIIPNLHDYPGPVVCIDPKGENARITAHYRARFGPVHVLDPFGVTGMVEAAFNPLARIDPVGLDLADDAMSRPQIAPVATFPFPLPSQSDRHPIRPAFLESQFGMVPLALWWRCGRSV